ncbi:MAG: helix-turn-helix domain-containing protein [Dysosmobacter sp.]
MSAGRCPRNRGRPGTYRGLRKRKEQPMAKEQVSSILRALQILECFTDNETEWTLKALVEQLGLPTTTVFRQLSTLTDRQYLEQDPIRKSYRVGPRLLQLSSAIVGQSDLRRAPGRSWSGSVTRYRRPSTSVYCWSMIFSIWTRWRPTAPWCAIPVWEAALRHMPPAAARRCWPAGSRRRSMHTAGGWRRRPAR